ncbi:MAG: winged helix-turn-helix transcriptional regulator [Flavobacteriaceae bacterium]|nr:winged helix-turn-helix transcriptional regulator [Flavobacteriaceae bacterium]
MKNFTDFFKALSDETRLRILHLLRNSTVEICVCEFTDILEIPTYNISKHLKILKNTGLLSERKEGRWVYFKLTDTQDKFTQLIFNALQEISSLQLEKDLVALKKRLDLRMKGKCLLGVQKEHLKTKNKETISKS